MSKLARWLLLTCVSALGACLIDEGTPNHPAIHTSEPALLVDASALDAPVASDSSMEISHLPCPIEVLIRTRCASCHSPSTLPHRPISLLSYEELLRPSASVPSQTYAQRAAALLASGMMPPTAALPATEVELFASWVRGGAPAGECAPEAGAHGAASPLDAHVVPLEAAVPDATAREASAPRW